MPSGIAGVVEAVHHACETLTQLAEAEQSKITTARRAGPAAGADQEPARQLRHPYRFAPAPQTYIEPLLSAYRISGTASSQLTAAVAHLAASVRSPSRTLTAARQAAHGTGALTTKGDRDADAEPESRQDLSSGLPGPVERILHDLGVTSPAALARAIAIDQVADQLILDSACQAGADRENAAGCDLSRSAGAAELINHLFASGAVHDNAAALMPAPATRHAMEAEIEA